MVARTEQSHASDESLGLSAWTKTVADNFAQARIERAGAKFSAIMHTTQLDGIHISRVQAPVHVVERTAAHIGPNERSRFVLCLQLSGRSMVVQDGREALLSRGDMTIYDTARPYTLVHENDVNCIGVVIPEGRVNLAPSTLRPLIATHMSHNDLFTQTTGYAIEKFQQGIQEIANPTRYRLGQTFASLFETLCMSWLTQNATADFDPKSGLRESVMRFIDDHLQDPNLNPTEIAAAHFISLRSLHSLAQQSGSTVAGWIRTRRLERCKADLTDPSFAHVNVAEIGARWGFTHPPHFTTLFRTQFGVTPSVYRKQLFS